LPSIGEVQEERENEGSKASKSLFPNPYMPPLPFLQGVAKPKLNHQFGKFLDMLKKLHVNVPFIDALSHMPMYAQFLKEILSKKGKVNEHETIALGEECSVVVLNKLPTKLKDSGSFFIPCMIGRASIDRALCDLGSSMSLMSTSIFKRLDLGELRPINISLQFADRSIKCYTHVPILKPRYEASLHIRKGWVLGQLK